MIKMLVIYLAVTFSYFQTFSAQIISLNTLQVCPRFWIEYKLLNSSQTKCFKPFYEMVGRDEAQRRCQQMGIGFDLIEIHSMNENDLIVKTLAQNVFRVNEFNDDMFNNYRPQVWIGAKRVPFGGIKDFQYRSGCGIKDFSFWHKGQPNDHNNNEDCVLMMIDQYFMGMWADHNCDTKMYYICQFVTDLSPPCNQTNYNLFGYNETNSGIHLINTQNGKTNSTPHKNPSKGNINSLHQWNRPMTLNPFNFINRLFNIFRRN